MAVIKNSVGSKMFRNSYAKVNGKKTDILDDGELSCAFFVSSILAIFPLFELLKYPPHATVEGTVKDLERSGWRKIPAAKEPQIGSIIVWEKKNFGKNDFHKHIGFYIGGKNAISNSLKKRTPIIHHWTYGEKNGRPVRKIEAVYWNKKLSKK